MRLREVPVLYRRAILIYLATIVTPACGLVWLGVQSFERQRKALASLTEEKLAEALETRTRQEAEAALLRNDHQLAKFYFQMERGNVLYPRLHALPPLPVPPEFHAAEVQEFEENRPDLALESYRQLAANKRWASLAQSRVARCLVKLGRNEEAKAAWRTLAASHPDDRDLSHRPYGIVAAIEAGETKGLYDQIASGRWDLAADQAVYLLSRLDPNRRTTYLERFQFARDASEQFRPNATVRENEIYSAQLAGQRILYRSAGENVIRGLAVDPSWIDSTLRPRVKRELGFTSTGEQDLRFYGGAVAVVVLILAIGVILLLRDVSRESHTSRLRSDFVSGVSHELRTPITLIRLYSETLLRQARGLQAGASEGERVDFYRIILRESERLGQLVDRILVFSRMERGDQVYRMEQGDLGAAIARVIDEYQEHLDRSGFHLTRNLADSMPPVRFDGAALEQAVVNLLDNAVKYSGDSREIAVRLDAHGGRVSFEVEDRGMGIAAAEQAKIFDRFYRAANGNGKGGYGLGLSLVRNIMDAHGGHAEVESEPGRGSRFRLVFPVVKEWINSAS